MSTKMLIDASHPEETRVAVLKGDRVEEFDFESQNRKQLRGNIYLAKVTRVEPSLQAAFIEYGGNRHGFLAFSEIHPDYYQIPLADRQSLLREEAESAARESEADEPADDASEDEDSDEAEVEASAPKRRRRSRRRSKSSDESGTASDDADTDDDEPSRTMAADNDSDFVSEPANGEEPPRPPRRTTRRKKPVEAATDDGAPSEAAPVEATDEKPKPRRRTRTKKATEEEPAAEAAPSEDTENDEKPKRRTARRKKAESTEGESTDAVGEDAPAEEAPKRRTRRSAKAPEPLAGASAQSAEEAPADEEAPKPKRRSRRKKADAESETEATDAEVAVDQQAESASADGETEGEEPAKPKRRARRSRAKKADDASEADATDDADGKAETVGASDALEEVPVHRPKRRHYKIQEVIKRRQIMLVQVVKEERGNKGAALTTYLSLAGRYSVLMPNTARGGGISRKITNAADRKKLKEIASSLEVSEGMGVILRTAGADRSRSEIQRDFEYLLRLWENVRTLTLKSTAPCLVYEEGSLIKRSIRDLFDKETKEIWVAGREGYEEASDFMQMLEPEQVKAVRHYNERAPLFAKMGVDSQLDGMLQPQVTLKSGGYLVINQTEALVAIDVNSGKSTRQHSIEETAYQTNLEAADEVARQLRLRDLAGLIVIDFIDMDERRNNRNVEKRMKDALKNDRARIQVGRISHFGLMEMSRQRMRASVIESATETCPVCAGLGYVRSPSSVSIHVLRGIEEHLLRNSKNDITVRTRMQTALYILNHKRSSIDDLEERFGVRITVEADETMGQSHYAIDRGEASSARAVDDRHVQVDSIQPENVAEAEETTDEIARTSEASADDGGGKRKRRGRRGGRKSRSDGDEIADTNAEEPTAASAEDGDAASEEAEKPKRRRRRKAATEEVDVAPDVEEVETEPAAEARAPKRRSTRRKKSTEEALGASAVHATSDAVLEGAVAEPIEPSERKQAENAAPDEPPRPPRRRTSRVATKDEDGDAEPKKQGWLKRTFFPE